MSEMKRQGASQVMKQKMKILRERFFENMIYREAALKSAAFFVYK